MERRVSNGRCTRASSVTAPSHSRAIPIHNASGEIVEWFGAASDVTRRKEAEAALQQRAAQQAAVAALSKTALAETSLDSLMDEVAHLVAHTLQTEFAKVLELAPDGRGLLLRAGVGWRPGLVGHAVVGAGRDSQAGFTLLTDSPVIVADLRTETRFTAPSLLRDHGVVSGMSCVIRTSNGTAYGVLETHTRSRREFSEDDVNFLRAIANVLAAAIERHRAEAARRENEPRLVTLFEALPVGVATMDGDGKLVVSNQEMGRYLPTGLIPSRDEQRFARGRGTLPDRRPVDRGDYPGARALRGERVVPGVEFRYTQDDGTELWTQISAIPLRAGDGRITGNVVVNDIDAGIASCGLLTTRKGDPDDGDRGNSGG